MTDIWGGPARQSAPGRTAFLPSPIFLAIAAVFVAAGTALWTGLAAPFTVFGFVLSGWLLSLCLHEYAHALVAYAGGDKSVAAKGYLRLDPFKYANAMFSIGLPLLFVLLGGIGLPGGAVYIERHRLRGRLAESLVSLAGPSVNVVFAVLTLAPVAAASTDGRHSSFWFALAFLGFLQVTASLLNLLPVPGLDGFGVLSPWLPRRALELAARIGPFGVLGVFLLLWIPQVNVLFFSTILRILDKTGIWPDLIAAGRDLFEFWN
jgi:Zn-dependent protease